MAASLPDLHDDLYQDGIVGRLTLASHLVLTWEYAGANPRFLQFDA